MDIKALETSIQAKIAERKKDTNQIKNLLTYVDLTTLEATDNGSVVEKLCNKAKHTGTSANPIPQVAAVCVYPTMVGFAQKFLKGTTINIAAVAGAFPSGQSPLNLRVEEVKYTVAQGAHEIDMVISRGRFLEGDYNFIKQEVAEIKKACGKAHLKVILETGELKTPENITKASELAIEAGADFIKTSTGKTQPAATFESAFYMLHAIKSHYEKTGIKIGFKPAGGIADIDTAFMYLLMVEEILGAQWLNNHLFRIGASRLVDRIYEAVGLQ